MKKLHNLLLGCLVLTLGFTSCNKDDETELAAEDTQAVLAETSADAAFEDVDGIAFNAMVSTGSFPGRLHESSRLTGSCATVTRDEDSRTITIDFGAGGCTDALGNSRSGKIMLTYTQSSWSMTFEAFKLGDKTIEGQRTISIETSDADSRSYTMKVVLKNGKITWEDGTFISREADRTKTWRMLQGEWEIRGTASGTDRNGQQYSSTITSPLLYLQSCLEKEVFVPVKGVLVIERTQPKKENLSIDFGDGSCDKLVKVTSGGVTKEIEIGS